MILLGVKDYEQTQARLENLESAMIFLKRTKTELEGSSFTDSLGHVEMALEILEQNEVDLTNALYQYDRLTE